MTATKELWKPLVFKGIHSDIYEVSSEGLVKNKLTDRLLKPQDSGYLHVRIPLEGKYYNARIHRIIAETFCERPAGCNVVNHINGDKKDNRASNLEWITQRDNVIHSIKLREEESKHLSMIEKMDMLLEKLIPSPEAKYNFMEEYVEWLKG
ncbi:DNA endonuclease I [Enterococcus phage vB_OCPT_Toy]|nr:DNA endonuclease I [Enterococcus phage vB_OCPT_Toy]